MFVIRQLTAGEAAEVKVSKVVDNSKGYVDLSSPERDIPAGLFHPPTGTLIVDQRMLLGVTPAPEPTPPTQPAPAATTPARPTVPPPPTATR